MKKLKDNEYFIKLKEIWQHPRYHALIVLGFYIIFFAFVITYINGMNRLDTKIPNDNIEETHTALETLESMDNYAYNMIIYQDDNEDIIDGIRYLKTEDITINNTKYYINDKTIYRINGNKISELKDTILAIDISKFYPNNIANLIKSITPVTSITYEDTTIEKRYSITSQSFLSMYNLEIEPEQILDTYIDIVTYEKDNYIYKIDINLTNIKNIFNIEADIWQLIINYSKINQIAKIDFNYVEEVTDASN